MMLGSLNDNHKRHLVTTFEHVDRLLTDSLRALNGAELASPFQRCVQDSLPIQRKVLADYAARLRALMVRILEDQGIEIPKPRISSLWSLKSTLMTAAIAIEELRPKYMRGYGNLSDEATQGLESLTSQITDILDRMSDYLGRGAGPDLDARLKKLETGDREVERARVLEEVITAHGIVELRPSLDAVVSRLESAIFEIAVFGRVSSGKSSLLNHILKTDALPVGVTPVTAIPTRVRFGTQPRARIWFAENEPTAVPLRDLSHYVTEQGNPNNAKHVTRIQVELPAERLKNGVTFVDTPGLGSLARYGEMESLAYLPRCDLGIVVVDAASTLVPEDAVVVDALRQAGADVAVLLTKADILAPAERTAAAQYVKAQLGSNLGFDMPVHVVSMKGADAKLCDRWFDTWLVPRLQEHKRLAEASLRRKIGLLRDATVAVLQRRLDKRSGITKDQAKEWAAAESRLNEALAELEAATRERPTWPGLAERILDDTAREIAGQWRKHGSVQVNGTTVVVSRGTEAVSRVATEVARSLTLLREDLTGALRAASAVAANDTDDTVEIPAPTGMPIIGLADGLIEAPLNRPALAGLLESLALRSARGQLDRVLGPRLDAILDQHFKQLSQWRAHVLTRMRQSFTAKADFFRSQCEQALVSTDSAAVECDIKRLQALDPDTQSIPEQHAAVGPEQA
jgi:GTP-binding protein EngB required for normal cell division